MQGLASERSMDSSSMVTVGKSENRGTDAGMWAHELVGVYRGSSLIASVFSEMEESRSSSESVVGRRGWRFKEEVFLERGKIQGPQSVMAEQNPLEQGSPTPGPRLVRGLLGTGPHSRR